MDRWYFTKRACLLASLIGCGPLEGVEVLNSEVMQQAIPSAPWANNVIELRNDWSGSQYYILRERSAFHTPVYNYFTSNGEWQGEDNTIHGLTLPKTPLWVIEVEYSAADATTDYLSTYEGGVPHFMDVFEHKNVPDVAMNPLFFDSGHYDENTPGISTSKTFMNAALDWAYLVDKKNEALAWAGIDDNASDEAKAKAANQYILEVLNYQDHPNPSGRDYRHPVDMLEKGSDCGGRAHALVALCAVMGIPARSVGWFNHTVAEVYYNDSWHYAENNQDIVKMNTIYGANTGNGPWGLATYPFSFQDYIMDPAAHGGSYWKNMGNYDLIQKSTGAYKNIFQYRVAAYKTGVYPNLGSTYSHTPHGVSRLWAHSPMAQTIAYPGDTSLDYKIVTENAKKMILTYTRTTDDNEESMSSTISQGQGVRQPFYLSTLNNVSRVKAYLLIAKSPDQHNIPPGGGDWYYVVNGQRFNLSDNGGWTVRSNFGSERLSSPKYNYVEFDIPLSALNANSCTNPGNCVSLDGPVEDPPTVLFDDRFNKRDQGKSGASWDNWTEGGAAKFWTYNIHASGTYPARASGNHVASIRYSNTESSLELKSTIDTSSADSIEVNFLRFVDAKLDSADYIKFRVKATTGWEIVESWDGNSPNADQWFNKNYVFTDNKYRWSGFKIGFLAKMDAGAKDEWVQIDDVEILAHL